jgi:hypothetical protein
MFTNISIKQYNAKLGLRLNRTASSTALALSEPFVGN